MEIRLLVLRTAAPATLADFYGRLGLRFEHHQHGNGPWHYAAAAGTAMLEIYPLLKSQEAADASLRLGLTLDDFEATLQRLRAAGTPFAAEPIQTDYGFMAVVQDPDGRKIELYRS